MKAEPAEDFLSQFDVNVWKRGDERAPHKPLLVLLALARVQRREPRLMRFAEIHEQLESLIREFGPKRRSIHPEFPFWYLESDGIWAVQGREELLSSVKDRKRSRDIPRALLLRADARGGFTLEVENALKRDPALLHAAAARILEKHFPSSIHEDILNAVGLSWEFVSGRRKRDPAFRELILRAYEHRCAVCGYDGRLGSSDLGLEAAHVRWHTHGGPDEVSNGIGLCVFHHRALDRGAIGIDSEYRLLVSQDVHGGTGVAEWLLRYHGNRIGAPQRGHALPDPKHVAWHRAEVFHGDPRL